MENTQPNYNPPTQWSYPQQTWQQPPAKRTSKKKVAAYVAGAFALVIFGAAVGGSGSDSEASPQPAVTVTAEAQPAVTVTAEASTPESCILALNLAEEIDAVKSDYIALVGQHFTDEAKVWDALANGDMAGVDLYWEQFEQMNSEVEEKVSQIDPLLLKYSAASLECRG